jgi:hypothetical protein
MSGGGSGGGGAGGGGSLDKISLLLLCGFLLANLGRCRFET